MRAGEPSVRGLTGNLPGPRAAAACTRMVCTCEEQVLVTSSSHAGGSVADTGVPCGRQAGGPCALSSLHLGVGRDFREAWSRCAHTLCLPFL